MTRQELVSFALFEKPIEFVSDLPPGAILSYIAERTLTTSMRNIFVRYDTKVPLSGSFEGHSGVVRHRDPYLTIPGARQAIFKIEPEGTGSRLTGVLRLRPGYIVYEAYGVGGMLVLQIWMAFMVIQHGTISWRGAGQILQQFLILPFLWLYLRSAIWFGRKKERRLLALLSDATSGTPKAPSP